MLVVLRVAGIQRLLQLVDDRADESEEHKGSEDQVSIENRVSVHECAFRDNNLFAERGSTCARVKLGGEVRILESIGLKEEKTY